MRFPCPVCRENGSVMSIKTHGLDLTTQQRSIFFDQLLHGNAPCYVVGGYYACRTVCPHRLDSAIRKVLARNDGLRVVIRQDETGPWQEIAETPAAPVLTVHDFRAAGDAAALAYLKQAFSAPIPLDGGPLYRFELCLGDTRTFWSFAVHHIATDGYGSALLVQEIAAAYNDQPMAPAVSYSEAVSDDAEYLASQAYESDRAFWREAIGHVQEPLLPRRHAATYPGQITPSDVLDLMLPRSFYDRLLAQAATRGLSFQHLLLGAFACIYARTADREAVTFGVPLANRRGQAAKQTIGLFASTVPVKVNVDPTASLDDLLADTSRALRRIYRHRRLPADEIFRLSDASERSEGKLFDITLSYTNLDYTLNLDGETVHVVPLDNGCEQMPLTLQVRDFQATGDVRLAFMHNLAFLDQDEVRALQARLVHVLTAMLETPDLPVGELDIRPPEERALLAHHGTGVDAPTAGGRTLFDLIAQQAKETPDAIALVQSAERWRYAELLSQAECIATALVKAGVEPGRPVLHCAHRAPVAIAGILGIWRAGGVYVPADPDYPDARLAFMTTDCGACAVLTDAGLAPRLEAALDLPTVALDKIEAPDSAAARPVGPDPEGPAYIIYTSGSTGAPKGVQVSQTAITGHILGICDIYALAPDDVVLAFSSLSFDASLDTLMGALIKGGGVVLRGDSLWTPEELHDIILTESISVANLSPAYFAQWVAAWPDLPPLADSALRLLISGGDILDNSVVPAVEAAGVRLLNAYGPTEAVITATTFEATGPAKAHESKAGARRTLPIGRPTPGRQFHILDAHGRPQAHGAEGKLHIGGPFLADGYVARPELTAKRFIPDPFSKDPGARLYCSGDICRWLPDGNLEFLGRLDDQVQVNGHRVELGEVEAAARDLPEVSDCAATLAQDNSGTYLVLHVVMNPSQKETEDQSLRKALANRLPSHMVPASFLRHTELPRLASGKIDRAALAEHQPEPTVAAAAETPPTTPGEQHLATIWAEILERSAPNVHDNFFSLGGHSLLAMQLVSQVRTAFGVDLSMREVFDAPTLAELAALLEEKTALTTEKVTEPDTPGSNEFVDSSREQHLI